MRREAVVIVAAGVGRRLGASGDGPKALVSLAGRTLLELAIRGVREAAVQDVVVVHTPGWERPFADVCERAGVLRLVPGGETRTDSVRRGLAELPSDLEVVAIHDAARPLTPPEVIRSVLDVVADDVVAAAPALPVADTLKRVEGDRVVGTVDRSDLRAVHTPQAFRPDALALALDHGDAATDDLSLVERAIADGALTGEVRLVAGSPWDLKITYPQDLRVAEALLGAPPHGGRP